MGSQNVCLTYIHSISAMFWMQKRIFSPQIFEINPFSHAFFSSPEHRFIVESEAASGIQDLLKVVFQGSFFFFLVYLRVGKSERRDFIYSQSKKTLCCQQNTSQRAGKRAAQTKIFYIFLMNIYKNYKTNKTETTTLLQTFWGRVNKILRWIICLCQYQLYYLLCPVFAQNTAVSDKQKQDSSSGLLRPKLMLYIRTVPGTKLILNTYFLI